MEDKSYYVYVYLDPRKPGKYIYGEYNFDYEPFYIGKGKGLRMYSHLCCKSSNTYKDNKIKKILKENLEPVIFKIREELVEEEAYNLEVVLIALIGRINLKLGPLTNITEGGGKIGPLYKEFNSFFRKHHTEESKESKRTLMKEKLKDPKELEKYRKGWVKGNLTRIEKYNSGELSGSFKGKKHSEETKEKMREKAKQRTGSKNSQFRTCWIYNEELKLNKKINKEEEIPNGWKLGRKVLKYALVDELA